MARPLAVDPHDRRRSPSQRRTSPSHQLRRTPGEKQRPRSYKPPGQTVKTADSARTMSGALNSARFLAAFTSRSSTRGHIMHTYVRSDRASLAFNAPHPEQVLLDGNHRSATTVIARSSQRDGGGSSHIA